MSFVTRRHRRVTIKGKPVTEQDWRGLLAIMTTIGYLSNSTLAIIRFGFTEAIAAIGFLLAPEMLVLNWYFRAREEGN